MLALWLMAASGHVWTAPWQELSDVYAALVGCGHVSGLLVRQVWPLALMLCADLVPNKLAHFGRGALTQAGFSRSPERPYLHYVVVPSPIGVADLAAGLRHGASNSFGSLYLSSRTMMAQAIRAILLASATAATFVGRRSINRPSHA
jgi:hypothetical protein